MKDRARRCTGTLMPMGCYQDSVEEDDDVLSVAQIAVAGPASHVPPAKTEEDKRPGSLGTWGPPDTSPAEHDNKYLRDFEPVDWTDLVHSVEVPDDPAGITIARTEPPGATSLDSFDLRERSDWNRRSWKALDGVAGQLESSWRSMAPAVIAFNHARGEIKQGGTLGPAPAGENWNAVPESADRYDLAAGEQTVGKTTKVKDLFDSKDQVSGVGDEAVQAAKNETVSKLLEQARVADRDVDQAKNAYVDHFGVIHVAANAVQQAANNTKIDEANDDKDKATANKLAAEKKKEKAGALLQEALKTLATIGVTLVVPEYGVAIGIQGEKKVEEAAKDAAGYVGGVLASKISSGAIDQQIEAANAQIEAATQAIHELTAKNHALDLDSAMTTYQMHYKQLRTKTYEVQKAITKRHDAYHHAAQAVGSSAAKGGGPNAEQQGERIGASIEAIPKVQAVVGRIHDALDKMVVPSHSDSGDDFWAKLQVGYALKVPEHFDVWALAQANAMMKAYQRRFESLRAEWEAKLKSLDALTMKLNVAGT